MRVLWLALVGLAVAWSSQARTLVYDLTYKFPFWYRTVDETLHSTPYAYSEILLLTVDDQTGAITEGYVYDYGHFYDDGKPLPATYYFGPYGFYDSLLRIGRIDDKRAYVALWGDTVLLGTLKNGVLTKAKGSVTSVDNHSGPDFEVSLATVTLKLHAKLTATVAEAISQGGTLADEGQAIIEAYLVAKGYPEI